MKTFMIIIAMMLLSVVSYSQTYKSAYSTNKKASFETDWKDRVITINDKEISITNFIEGTKTQYLIVNRIENKDWSFDGVCKTYYCTTKDKDFMNGYQKAILYVTYDNIHFALFATEILVFNYIFSIK